MSLEFEITRWVTGPAAIFEQMWRSSEKECEELRAEIERLRAEVGRLEDVCRRYREMAILGLMSGMDTDTIAKAEGK